ncbi:glycosyltransferase family 2 protein [Ekhidna sp.]
MSASYSPYVSVLIITYNRVRLLDNTIQSVLDQTYKNCELIIIDDGSTDDTEKLVKSIKTDRNIKYYRLEHSGHIAKVRNYGLKKCTGELIAFLDSDDLWQPERLETQILAFQTSEIGFAFCNVHIQENHSDLIYSLYDENLLNAMSSFNRRDMLEVIIYNKLQVYSSSLIVRKSAIEEMGLFSEKRRIMEMHLIGKMASVYDSDISNLNLVTIVKHSENSTKQKDHTFFYEKFDLLSDLLSTKKITIKEYRKAKGLHYYDMAKSVSSYGVRFWAFCLGIIYHPNILRDFFKSLGNLVNDTATNLTKV